MTTDLGELSLNGHRGQAIRRQPDAATLRHVGHDLYANDRRVYLLRREMDGIHSHFRDQRIPGADAASFVADDMSTARPAPAVSVRAGRGPGCRHGIPSRARPAGEPTPGRPANST